MLRLPLAQPEATAPDKLPLDLEDAILQLRQQRNAVILAHYYQDSEVQDLADFVGDSLQLAQAAQRTKADVILFCGVHFMAETAKILNPTRTVLLPDLAAGCSLADGCPPEKLRLWMDRYPDHTLVSYINCSAAVKAMSDCIVTSSNAEKIIRSYPASQPILFAPDQHLGRWLIRQTGRDNMVVYPGSCMVHEIFSERELVRLRMDHPRAQVLAHPECDERVLRHADFVGSTSAIIRYAVDSPAQEFIIATEPGVIHEMQKRAPGKRFIPAPAEGGCACNQCPHMRLNTLEKVYLALRDLSPEVTLPEDLRLRALRPIEKMLALS
ncbi:MAG: quinolinate synthase NadA [Myxococcales bacterium]|nr:quinolinate synthase NadA [Myxococcota bacterium]MDW8284093.1 quinolinate synthase NadA [Myxococcales bacterium]